MTGDRADCLRRLVEYETEISALASMASESTVLPRPKSDEARELLKALKKRLQTDVRELRKRRLTPEEQAFLYPALQEVFGKLSIRANSRPGRNWLDNLYEQEFTLRWYIDQLRD